MRWASSLRVRSGEAHRPLLDEWRRKWTSQAESGVLGAYFVTLDESPEGRALVPDDPRDRTLLLDAHVLLKALYEVRYELANRPTWVSWPLAGIAAMLAERER